MSGHKMFRALFRGWAAIFLVVLLASPGQADTFAVDDPNSAFLIGNASGFGGVDTVVIPVSFNSDSAITNFHTTITWDSSQLALVEAYRGEAWAESVGTFDTTFTESSFRVVDAYAHDPDGVVFEDTLPVFYLRFAVACFTPGTSASIVFSNEEYANMFVSGGHMYTPSLENGWVAIPYYNVLNWLYLYGERDIIAGEQDFTYGIRIYQLEFPATRFVHHLTFDTTMLECLGAVQPEQGTITVSRQGDTLEVVGDGLRLGPITETGYLDTLYVLRFSARPPYPDDTTANLLRIVGAKDSIYSDGCLAAPVFTTHYPGVIDIQRCSGMAKIATVEYDTSDTQYELPFKIRMDNGYPFGEFSFRISFPDDTLRYTGFSVVPDFVHLPINCYCPYVDDSSVVRCDMSPTQDSVWADWLTTFFKLQFDRKVSIDQELIVPVEFLTQPSSGNYLRYFIDAGHWIDVMALDPPDDDLTLISGGIDIEIPSGNGGGCPFVYAWDGMRYVMDNPVLTESEDELRDSLFVDDYYFMAQEPLLCSGHYKLRISEAEQEISEFDQVQLITVDHPKDVETGVFKNGEIFAYKQEIAFLSCIDHKGEEVLKLVESEDGKRYVCEGPGHLILDGGVLKDKDRFPQKTVFIAPWIRKAEYAELEEAISVEVWSSDGWYMLETPPPRENPYPAFVEVNTQDFKLTEELRFRISWDDSCAIDVVKYYVVDPEVELDVQRAQLLSAKHSRLGEVLEVLVGNDEHTVPLQPTEQVDLQFGSAEPKAGLERDFIFASLGYYQHPKLSAPSDDRPNQPILFNNRPNPFNAGTKISYYLGRDAQVTLCIYNVLGKKIRTLVQEPQCQGHQSVIWDGRNQNGKEVASGVYFFVLKQGDMTLTKKMLLLK